MEDSLLTKISELKLDPYINIVVFGDKIRLDFINGWAQISEPDQEFQQLNLYAKKYTICEQDLHCNLWSVSPSTTNNTRYFFSNQINYCLILCNIQVQTRKDLLSYIGSITTLCPNIRYLVVGGYYNKKHRQVEIGNYCEEKSLDYHELCLDQGDVCNKIIELIINRVFQERKDMINLQFRELVNKD